MSTGNRFNILLSVMAIAAVVAAMQGCSSKSDQQAAADTDNLATSDTTESSLSKQIESIINEAMVRLRYRDKTFLYELEFTYYKDEHTFDDYLKEGRILNARADTLEYVDVVNVTTFDDDSALAEVEVHFKGSSSEETVRKGDKLTFYRHNGRWIKPTVSTIAGQRRYDRIRYQADSAAKAESGELGNE